MWELFSTAVYWLDIHVVWPVLLWGPLCQKSLEAESHHPLRNEGFPAIKGPRASWYIEDEYLYTVLKLALFLRLGLVICVGITNSSLLSSLKRVMRVRSPKEPIITWWTGYKRLFTDPVRSLTSYVTWPNSHKLSEVDCCNGEANLSTSLLTGSCVLSLSCQPIFFQIGKRLNLTYFPSFLGDRVSWMTDTPTVSTQHCWSKKLLVLPLNQQDQD